jgi:hypothetical protein
MAQMMKYAAIALIGVLAWQFAGRAFLGQAYHSAIKTAQTKSDFHFDRPPELHFDRPPELERAMRDLDKPPSSPLAR